MKVIVCIWTTVGTTLYPAPQWVVEIHLTAAAIKMLVWLEYLTVSSQHHKKWFQLCFSVIYTLDLSSSHFKPIQVLSKPFAFLNTLVIIWPTTLKEYTERLVLHGWYLLVHAKLACSIEQTNIAFYIVMCNLATIEQWINTWNSSKSSYN